MKRIREKNINTGEHFDSLFKENTEQYSSYGHIKIYDSILKLRLFEAESVLDYGCANAHSFAEVTKEKKVCGIGIDISSWIIAKNRKMFPEMDFHTVEDFVSSDIVADTIISTHTLEHTDDPLSVASLLLKRSKEKLLIVVPYKDSWNKCPEHLWKFDKRSFESLGPTMVQTGIINSAGYTEILYFWDKTTPKKSIIAKRLKRSLKISPYHSLKGLIKKILFLI